MSFKAGLLLFVFVVIFVQTASCGKITILGEIPIGGECQAGLDCVAPGKSECSLGDPKVSQICKCKPDFVPQLDKLDCLEVRHEVGDGQDCLESQQCAVANSECSGSPGSSKMCDCLWDFIVHPTNPSKCIKMAFVGDPCNEHDNQCGDLAFGSTCQGPPGNRTCTCPINHVPSEDRLECLKEATQLGEPCQEVVQCLGAVAHSDCVGPWRNKTCQCHANYIAPPGDNLKCNMRSLLVGSPCNEHDNQCGIEHASCVMGPAGAKNCNCTAATHTSSMDRRSCLEIAEGLDGTCKEDAQCAAAVENSRCRGAWAIEGGKCECSVDFIAPPSDKRRCNRKAKTIGDSCALHDNQCGDLRGSSCQVKNGLRTCECLEDYKKTPSGMSCYKNITPGGFPVLTLVLSALGTAAIVVVVVVGVVIYRRRRRS